MPRRIAFRPRAPAPPASPAPALGTTRTRTASSPRVRAPPRRSWRPLGSWDGRLYHAPACGYDRFVNVRTFIMTVSLVLSVLIGLVLARGRGGGAGGEAAATDTGGGGELLIGISLDTL